MSESRTKRFQDFISFQESNSLRESVEGEAKEIEKEIEPEEIEDIDPDKVAATLSALIDAGGNLDKIDMDQIEENFQQILEDSEKEGTDINESETGVVYVLEVVGSILGNVDLLHFIGDALSKKLGKKVDLTKFASSILKIIDFIKKITGFPAKILKKFFEWIGKILGLDKAGSKLMGLTGLGVATVILMVVGIVFFPAAAAITGTSGVLALILSVTALIGKVTEITVVTQEIIKVIRVELHKEIKHEEPTEEDMNKAIGELTLTI